MTLQTETKLYFLKKEGTFLMKKAGIAAVLLFFGTFMTMPAYAAEIPNVGNELQQEIQGAEVEPEVAEEAEEAEMETEIDLGDSYNGNVLQEEYENVEVDSFTGNLDFTSLLVEEATNGRVELGDRVSFDITNRLFCYAISGGGEVYADAMDGAILVGTVSIFKSPNEKVTVYQNGTEITFDEQITLEEPGAYLVKVTEAGKENTLFSFTITNKVTNQLTGFEMPNGFRITSAYKDDVLLNTESYYVSMAEDGKYEINYECPLIGLSGCYTAVIDHTPPAMELTGINEKGYASGAIDVSCRDRDDELEIYYEGKEMMIPADNMVRYVGSYQLILTDQAGNKTEYAFVIKPYLNFSATTAIITFAVLVIGLIVFVIRTRKHLRVR